MNKTTIILGGSAGIGRKTAERLIEKGYKVGIIARGQDRLDAMKREFKDKIAVHAADGADAKALQKAYDGITQEIGTPEIWVNALMLTSFSPFEEMEIEEFETITNATYLGQVNGTRLALTAPNLKNIVNIGSGLSYRAVPYQSAYCAAKHAINGFSASVRSELIRQKRDVALSLVQLPAVNTPQFEWARSRLEKQPQPAPPIYQPDVAAKAVLKAIDTNAREILVGKSVFQLVFANMILPNFMDHKMAQAGLDMQKSDKDQDGYREGNVMAPATHQSTAYGDFGDRAEDDGIIMDADLARKLFFFGGAAILFLLGIIIGALF